MTKCGDCRHTHKHTSMHALTLFHTNTHIQTGGNGLAKLNKCNHCDLNGRQSRPDALKCALLFSFPFPINLSLLLLPQLVSVSAGVTLKSHSSAPSLLFPLHYSLFFHICISISSPSFNVFFFYLPCLFLLAFDPCVKSVQGPASQSPCCYDHGLTVVWRWPLNPRPWPFSVTPLSAAALSLHTASLCFICEHQFQQGSTTGRTWRGWSELGACVKPKKSETETG